MGVISTCIIVASIVTPLLSGMVVVIEKYLKCMQWAEPEYTDEHKYVELPRKIKTSMTDKDLLQTRLTFLNKTLYEASACNCPILCVLLIENGATELEAALEVAIVNGNTGICKILISNTAITTEILHKALETARNLKKEKIRRLIEEHLH
jgi:hypothetical protein